MFLEYANVHMFVISSSESWLRRVVRRRDSFFVIPTSVSAVFSAYARVCFYPRIHCLAYIQQNARFVDARDHHDVCERATRRLTHKWSVAGLLLPPVCCPAASSAKDSVPTSGKAIPPWWTFSSTQMRTHARARTHAYILLRTRDRECILVYIETTIQLMRG